MLCIGSLMNMPYCVPSRDIDMHVPACACLLLLSAQVLSCKPHITGMLQCDAYQTHRVWLAPADVFIMALADRLCDMALWLTCWQHGRPQHHWMLLGAEQLQIASSHVYNMSDWHPGALN